MRSSTCTTSTLPFSRKQSLVMVMEEERCRPSTSSPYLLPQPGCSSPISPVDLYFNTAPMCPP